MPYVNSKGEIVDSRTFSLVAFFLGIIGFITSFFRTLFHLDDTSTGSFLNFGSSSGGGSGSGYGSGGRGSANRKPGSNIRRLGPSGGPPPPPMGGCSSGGCCG